MVSIKLKISADALDDGLEIPLWKGHRFDLIFVDEYQDLSNAQTRFLQALARRYCSRVIGVGDDCQTVYTWAGANRNGIRDFAAVFGDTEAIEFDVSFRCTAPILATALRFIRDNPHQVEKNVTAHKTPPDNTGHRVLVVNTEELRSSIDVAIEEGFRRFTKAYPDRVPQVMVLAQKTDNLPSDKRRRELRQQYRVPMSFRSIHKSKGLGADIVIVCDLVGGTYGFPDRRLTDPLVETLLDSRPRYPDEDDRNLFYVAVTRAKEYVLLCTEVSRPSDFVFEILSYPEVSVIGPEPSAATVLACPRCESGILRAPKGKFTRWSCEYFDRCKATYSQCDRVGCRGPLLPLDTGDLRCAWCNYVAPRCSKCGKGSQLVRADKKYGCTRYVASATDRCTHRATAEEIEVILATRQVDGYS